VSRQVIQSQGAVPLQLARLRSQPNFRRTKCQLLLWARCCAVDQNITATSRKAAQSVDERMLCRGKAGALPCLVPVSRHFFHHLRPASRGVSGQPCRRGYDWKSPERLKVNRADQNGCSVSGVRCASLENHVSSEQ